MLMCSDGTYYVGISNDIDRRIHQHNAGSNEKAYTHSRRPVLLAYASLGFPYVLDAIAWEKRLKSWSHAKKGALARGDWDALRAVVRYERRGRERSDV